MFLDNLPEETAYKVIHGKNTLRTLFHAKESTIKIIIEPADITYKTVFIPRYMLEDFIDILRDTKKISDAHYESELKKENESN